MCCSPGLVPAHIAGVPRCSASSSELNVVILNCSWKTAFGANRFQIKNPAGFVGMDYIDDSDASRGFCIDITDRKAPGQFSIGLLFIGADGKVDEEALPIDIAWNSKAGRYQEVVSNEGDPVLFAPEKRNVPHINSQER